MTPQGSLKIVVLVGALSVLLEVFLRHEGHGPWWHVLPGFDLAFGIIGCVVLVLVAKAIGQTWLQRPETDNDRGTM